MGKQLDIRKMVIDELERRGKSWYWLGRQPGVTCHEDSIRAWLYRGSQLGADHVNEVMEFLGFRVSKPLAAASK